MVRVALGADVRHGQADAHAVAVLGAHARGAAPVEQRTGPRRRAERVDRVVVAAQREILGPRGGEDDAVDFGRRRLERPALVPELGGCGPVTRVVRDKGA